MSRLIRPKDLKAQIGLSDKALRRFRRQGTKYYRVGKKRNSPVLYDLEEVLEWIKSHYACHDVPARLRKQGGTYSEDPLKPRVYVK